MNVVKKEKVDEVANKLKMNVFFRLFHKLNYCSRETGFVTGVILTGCEEDQNEGKTNFEHFGA